MSLKPFFRLWRDGRLSPLVGAAGELKSFYKLSYLAAAGEGGLLNRLASGPATLDSLAEFFGANSRGLEALEAWLQMGIHLQLLSLGPGGYALRGLAKKLARPENDPVLAMVEEVSELHRKLITKTIPKLRAGELWSLDDQDGELIARSSRILRPFKQRSSGARSPRMVPFDCWRSAVDRGFTCGTQRKEILRYRLLGWSFSRRSPRWRGRIFVSGDSRTG